MVNGANTNIDTDKRIAHGARCTWWDSISRVGKRSGLPCCPHCRNMLFESPSEEEWFKAVDGFEKKGHGGYRSFVEWLRGKCFGNAVLAKAAYQQATGKNAGF